ncbi:MAG: hypothetical protein ABSA51_05235 [Anaerolineaceae bacterium]|jgi:hypothetical protein
MQKKPYVLMVVITMVALVLAGCNLPASQSPAATATSALPFPVATNDALVQNILRQTLTAAAANTTPMPTEAVATQAMPTVVATLSQFTPVVGSTSAALTATALPTSNPLYATAKPAIVYATPTAGVPTQFASCSGVPGYGSGVPIVTIVDVAQNAQVTIDGANFPTGQTLTVLMGPYGNAGAGGTQAGTISSGSSGCFNAAFAIPISLAGSFKIAIRVQTANGVFYGYNWFYNTNTR